MLEELRNLWNNGAYFRARVRGTITMVGALIASGTIPAPTDNGWWWGLIVMGAANFINAGQLNREAKLPAATK
jgi:hypothetical protein